MIHATVRIGDDNLVELAISLFLGNRIDVLAGSRINEHQAAARAFLVRDKRAVFKRDENVPGFVGIDPDRHHRLAHAVKEHHVPGSDSAIFRNEVGMPQLLLGHLPIEAGHGEVERAGPVEFPYIVCRDQGLSVRRTGI